ncbi:hypothetical protein DFH07DRAFT_972538 [Mycena maculata]|uniref:Uncharacterized protein n=1 Tax=Mycena maculata TaxID=230809 RepID=A0AAD7MKJ0_9AGAR|nr:hypothetical protein DFH07DRAFT_972538 [Mycena maculata]
MPDDTPYPGPAFVLNAPHLRTLALSNFVFPWDSSIFNNLTHLRDSAFAPSMTEMLGMLTCSPMLTEVVLIHAVANRLPCPESASVVPLTRLTILLLDDHILTPIFLLHHIDVLVHFSLSLKVGNRTKKMSLVTELDSRLHGCLFPDELTTLSVEADPWNVAVYGSTAASPANPLQATLRYSETFAEGGFATVVGTILVSLPLVAVTTSS